MENSDDPETQQQSKLDRFSSELSSPGSYFSPYEGTIASWDDLHSCISALLAKHPQFSFVWRGARDADWGLHSSLYRKLLEVNGVALPGEPLKNPRAQWPSEDQMVAAERSILALARADWRFDQMPALEIFARLQHYGAPTRLMDVSQNPYIAAWFAIERIGPSDQQDGRLFALATRASSRDNHQNSTPPEPVVQLDGVHGGREPFWHSLDKRSRISKAWGTGGLRRYWRPPAYDQRIVSQNAGFIFDGIPIVTAESASSFPKGSREKNDWWGKADLLASSSIYAKLYRPERKVIASKRAWAPTFSFRISKDAKETIRTHLQDHYGYRPSTIYPDMSGLANFLGEHGEVLSSGLHTSHDSPTPTNG